MYNTNFLYSKTGKIKHRMCIVICQAIILIFFVFVINNQSQACCYLAGYNFYYGIGSCTTAEECTGRAIMNGCSVYEVSSGYYLINCNGENSACGVNPNINCCALSPGSYGCIGNNPDPCFSKPDDPCCGNKKCDKTPAKQCAAPLENPAPASVDGAGFVGE